VTYLLDTNVVSYFLQAAREKELSEAAKNVPLAIVVEVRDELGADSKRGGPAFARWLAASAST
jgi:predicted nucleic acid-binding protein